jgi:hypothetical protein
VILSENQITRKQPDNGSRVCGVPQKAAVSGLKFEFQRLIKAGGANRMKTGGRLSQRFTSIIAFSAPRVNPFFILFDRMPHSGSRLFPCTHMDAPDIACRQPKTPPPHLKTRLNACILSFE